MIAIAERDEITGASPHQPMWWAWYGLGVVVLASVIGSLIGKGLISLVAESMKQSLKLSQSEAVPHRLGSELYHPVYQGLGIRET